jgi:hypothetical protein
VTQLRLSDLRPPIGVPPSGARMGRSYEDLAITKIDRCIRCLAQASRIRDDRIKYRLHGRLRGGSRLNLHYSPSEKRGGCQGFRIGMLLLHLLRSGIGTQETASHALVGSAYRGEPAIAVAVR